MKKSFFKRIAGAFLAVSMAAALVAGCGKSGETESESQSSTSESEAGSTSTPVAEAGTALAKVDPAAVAVKIGDDIEVPASEVFYVYYVLKQQMELTGVTDWGTELTAGYTYADYLKQMVESQVVTFEYLDSMTDKYKVKLTEEEEEAADEEVKKFLEAVPDEEKEAYGFNEENIRAMYDKTYLTNKVYEAVQKEAEEGLTKEELADCKFKEIQHILISTQNVEETDENGETTETAKDTEAYKAEQKAKAEEVLKKVKDGGDFEELAKEYTADSGVTYYLNEKGQTPDGAQMVDAFYKAANELKEGEVSGLVETEYGYHIIKCVSEDNADADETAKQKLIMTKVQEGYAAWSAENVAEFMDIWKNYAVVNPTVEAESETESGSEESQNESGKESDSETESSQESE